MQAKLVVVGGRATKKEVDVRLPFAIGRSDESNLTIEHRSISRQHCELFERNGRLVVRDLGSANGTYIGNRAISGEMVLEPGDSFTVGPLTFRAVYEVAAAPSTPEAESPAAGATLMEEDAATPVTDPPAFPAAESELDSFDLELSDDIDLPEFSRESIAGLAADEKTGVADPASGDLGDSLDELQLDEEIESEVLDLPLDMDEPPAGDLPADLAAALDLDLNETVKSSVKSDEALELDLGLNEAMQSEALAPPPLVEEDDSPTEIGEYVDLRDENATSDTDSSSAAPQNSTDAPADLPTELAALAPAEEPADGAALRDFSGVSQLDDAPSQELFLVEDEKTHTPTAASEPREEEEPLAVALDAELAAPTIEPGVEPTLEPAVDAVDELQANELTNESATHVELPDLASIDDVEEDLWLEEPLAHEPSSDVLSPERTAHAEAPDTHVEGALESGEDLLLVDDPAAPLASVEQGATKEPDFTAWMFEESLSAAAPETSTASDDDLPGLDAPPDELADSLALDDELSPLDHEADSLPPLEVHEAEAERHFQPLTTETPRGVDANLASSLELPAESAEEVSSLEEFRLEDSAEESGEIEFADFDLNDSAAGKEEAATNTDPSSAMDAVPEIELPEVEATAEAPSAEMLSRDEVSFDEELEVVSAVSTEPVLAAELHVEEATSLAAEVAAHEESSRANDEVSFDDWVAAELSARPAAANDEPVMLEAIDEPALPALDEDSARVSDEADAELHFDEVPSFDEEPKFDAELTFDEELKLDDFDAPAGDHERIELPAVFEETASLDLDVADREAAQAPVELPPTEPPKSKRNWWPFGRKREPKPTKALKPLKGKKKANQTLDATASLPLEELPGDEAKIKPAALSDEIEFSLDDAPEFKADDSMHASPASAGAELLDSPASMPQNYTPPDPLDELNFPLDDGGASLSQSELAFDEPKFEAAGFEPAFGESNVEAEEVEELSFDEPIAPPAADLVVSEPVTEAPVIDEPATAPREEIAEIEFASEEASSELESFSLDDVEPAIVFDAVEPDLSFDEIEAVGSTPVEEQHDLAASTASDPAAQPVLEDARPSLPVAKDVQAPPAAEQAAKPRRRWWPFGGKTKHSSSATAPAESKRSRVDKQKSRATLVPDDLSAADLQAAPPILDETDSERIARRLSNAPQVVEKYPRIDEDVMGADVDLSGFETNEAEAPVFSLDEDDEAPSFEMEVENLPHLIEDSDATTTANKSRSVGSEDASGQPESWSDRTSQGETRARRGRPQDPEDDWDNFLKSFDS